MRSRSIQKSRRTRGRPVPESGSYDSELAYALMSPLHWQFWAVVVGTLLLIFIPVALMSLPGLGSLGQSLILSGFVFVLCLICAAAVLYYGRATPVYARNVAIGFVVGGLAFGGWAFQTDYSQRITTLFEVEVEGSTGVRYGAEPPVHELSFTVVNPGVKHTLTFYPKMTGIASPEESAVVRVELRDAEGNTVLSREQRHDVSDGRGRDSWYSYSTSFTPEMGGRYTLLVSPVTPGIPLVHVRVTDPLYREGVRIEGY